MNFNNILGKIESNADKLGILAGIFAPLEGRGGTIDNIMRAIEQHDFQGAIAWLTDLHAYTSVEPEAGMFKAAITLMIAALGLEAVAPPALARYAQPMQKAGFGILIGLPIARFIGGLGRSASESHQPGTASQRRAGGGFNGGYGY